MSSILGWKGVGKDYRYLGSKNSNTRLNPGDDRVAKHSRCPHFFTSIVWTKNGQIKVLQLLPDK